MIREPNVHGWLILFFELVIIHSLLVIFSITDTSNIKAVLTTDNPLYTFSHLMGYINYGLETNKNGQR